MPSTSAGALHLIVCLLVHEIIVCAVVVEILHFMGEDRVVFQRLVLLERHIYHAPGTQVLHRRAIERGPLTGVHKLDLRHLMRLSIIDHRQAPAEIRRRNSCHSLSPPHLLLLLGGRTILGPASITYRE